MTEDIRRSCEKEFPERHGWNEKRNNAHNCLPQKFSINEEIIDHWLSPRNILTLDIFTTGSYCFN